MSEDHGVAIAVLETKLETLATALEQHRTESRAERVTLENMIREQGVKTQSLIDAWNGATLVGKVIGFLGAVAAVITSVIGLKEFFK